MRSSEIAYGSGDKTDPATQLPQNTARDRFRRAVRIVPGILTVANLICGYFVIRVAVDGNVWNYDRAALAIWIAWVFDALDGTIARAVGSSSDFGREFDSLADVVTFGIAPVMLADAWGFGATAGDRTQHILLPLSWLVGLSYLICCAWRLARFNLRIARPTEHRFFVGLPAPAAALTIAAVVHSFGHPVRDLRFSLLFLLLLVILGVLMVSSARYFSFKEVRWRPRPPSWAIGVVAFAVAAIAFFSRFALIGIAVAYLSHGLALELARHFRYRMLRNRET